MLLGKIVGAFARFSTRALRTQIYHTMDNKTLATPELVKRSLKERIPFHSHLSMIGLYHRKRVRHAIKSCFSEKKTKRFKRVHKIKREFFSQILGVKLYVRMTNKAFRCMKKMGSFDKYILLTPPKQLDSKMGEYYRTLMLRKINDPEYRVPYVIGSGKKVRIHQFQRYQWLKAQNKVIIPKDFKSKLMTFQRKFGTSPEQLNEDDYKKYLEVQKLKKLWGKDIDLKHPLLMEIKSKLEIELTQEEKAAMEERAEQYKREYLQHPKNTYLRQKNYEYNELEAQKDHLKLKEAWIKKDSYDDEEDQ